MLKFDHKIIAFLSTSTRLTPLTRDYFTKFTCLMVFHGIFRGEITEQLFLLLGIFSQTKRLFQWWSHTFDDRLRIDYYPLKGQHDKIAHLIESKIPEKSFIGGRRLGRLCQSTAIKKKCFVFSLCSLTGNSCLPFTLFPKFIFFPDVKRRFWFAV